MAHQVAWTKFIIETFEREAMLSDIERAVLRTRASGMSRVQQQMEFGLSQSSLDRIIKRLKVKYDKVQKENPILLPPRKFSAEETYMDEN